MISKIKNSKQLYLFFVTILTLSFLYSCKTSTYINYKIEGKKIPITSEFKTNEAIDAFVSPYRNHINQDLDVILSYCPETLDKSKGEFQTNIGNPELEGSEGQKQGARQLPRALFVIV